MESDSVIVPTSVEVPSSLEALAAKANQQHQAFVATARSMVEHAIACGEALAESKSRVEHGEWLPWLAEHFDASEGTAKRYIRLYTNRSRVIDLEEPSLRKALEAISSSTPKAHVSQNSGENEWYTPPHIIDAAVEVMGAIDLDPASSNQANASIGAADFYTINDSGLTHQWHGRVWLNPPYASDLVSRFVDKLVEEYVVDRVTEACLLSNNATETKWFQHAVRVANAVCFPEGRLSYWHPDRTSKTPLQGQAILYLGAGQDRFVSAFSPLGVVLRA